MLEKTIKTVVHKEINKWIDSIKDEQLKKDVKKEIIVTGGAIVSLVQNERPNDYDIYFKTKSMAKRVAEYYCDIWNENHKGQTNKLGVEFKAFVLDGSTDFIKISDDEYKINKDDLYYFLNGQETIQDGEHKEGKFNGQTRNIMSICGTDRLKIWIPSDGVVIDGNYYEAEDLVSVNTNEILEDLDEIKESEVQEPKEKYQPVFLTSNAISLSNKIQLVIRFWGEPEKIHETYDFLHCKGYWSSWDNKVDIPAKVYEAIINKTLIYTGSFYPICSLFRMRKFIKRDWNINAGQVLKIAWQCSELDLTDIDVLEDQLVGVDSLYFVSLINTLRNHKDKHSDWNISREYATSIIDKIF